MRTADAAVLSIGEDTFSVLAAALHPAAREGELTTIRVDGGKNEEVWKLSAKSGAVTKLTITSGDETREWTFAYEGKKLRSAKETVTAGGETQEGTALTWELNGGAVTGLTRRNADGTEEIWDVTVKDGRVEQAEVTRGGETETYTYAYDAEGRVSKAVTGTGEHTFRYDEDGLLTEVD